MNQQPFLIGYTVDVTNYLNYEKRISIITIMGWSGTVNQLFLLSDSCIFLQESKHFILKLFFFFLAKKNPCMKPRTHNMLN